MSNTGTWMQRVAQDWLVLELAVGSGATALGITTGLQFLPFLLLTPVAGLVADRMPKQRLLQLTNLGMALPAAVLGLLAVTGSAEVWHVYVLAFLLGCASAFDAPARQSFVSELVDPVDLTNAVGLNSASFNLASILGPALAGLMIHALVDGTSATGWVILINAVSYAAIIAQLQRMDLAQLHSPKPTGRRPGALLEGVRYHSDSHVLKAMRTLVFGAQQFGDTAPGGVVGAFRAGPKGEQVETHPGMGAVDGTIFVRAAGVMMDRLGWSGYGQQEANWDRSALGWDKAWETDD